jgi:mannose-6-phosphate isomerase-like protein (cupin superfamily)
MSDKADYVIQTDVAFGGLERIDLPAMVEACEHDWFNQSLCRVNDCVVRLGIFEGEFPFHKHDREDEVFVVLDGRLLMDFEDETVELGMHQAFLVPHGVRHRPRSPERSVVLMIEGATVNPTGDD